MDISDKVLARKELEKRDWQLRTIVNHSNDVFYYHDAVGNIEFISPLSTNVFGHSLEDLKSRWDTIATDNPINTAGREKTRLALETGLQQEPYILEIKDSTGNLKYVEIYESPVKDANGKVTGLTGAIRDVTKRAVAERERELLQNQLIQSQKMEAIGSLAGGVAHDFNNLMTVVTGYCDILTKKLSDREDLLDDLDGIRKAGLRASQLTGQLLAFSRKQILHMEVFNLTVEVRDTERMLARLIGEDVKLIVKDSSEKYLVRADKGQIQQILVNLAVNSRDAMPRGGEIRIEISSANTDDVFLKSHPSRDSSSYVLLSFSDNGIGMEDDIMSRIFEPFFTTKESGRGTGLGLSTVYGIVKQVGGLIDVNSQPEQGTVFRIYFPRQQSGEASIPLPENQLADCTNAKILLTEDDDAVREVVKTMLESSGFRVLEARDGKTAIRLYKDGYAGIDLLLTDVVMPLLGGVGLAEEIRKLNPRLKVLFMSGYTDNALQYKDVVKEGFAFINKPFDTSALVTAIGALLQKKPV